MPRQSLLVFKPQESASSLENAKNLKVTVARVAYRLFNEIDGLWVSLILWNQTEGKQIFKLIKQNLNKEFILPKGIQIKQFLEKDIDGTYKVDALLLSIKGDNGKTIDENVTAVFKDRWDVKELIHLHISEPKILKNGKIEKLPKKFDKNYRILSDKKHVWKWVEINLTQPEDIAKEIITKYWKQALTEGSNEVVKLFWPSAYLKGTVVSHLSVWDSKWVKDYFDHFCEKHPELKLNKITAKWLTPNKSILAFWEYTFVLDTDEGKRAPIDGNFTFIFKKIGDRWVIDVLHSSVKYNQEDWKRLNQI